MVPKTAILQYTTRLQKNVKSLIKITEKVMQSFLFNSLEDKDLNQIKKTNNLILMNVNKNNILYQKLYNKNHHF